MSIECFTCNYQCADYQLALNNSIPIFPLQQVCLPSPPPANTWTEIVAEMSAPIPFPPTFAPQYCCQLPSGHCSGGANDGATCGDESDCPNGVCAGRCFEYTLGLPGDQDCAQMGGSSLATYCGGKGTCGAD